MSVPDFAWQLNDYALQDTSRIITPALLIYPDKVRHNIEATLQMIGGDANRWRPHIKTAKIVAVIKEYIQKGVQQFKCSTTLELKTACEAGALDALVAFSMVGANARRVQELAQLYPGTRISVLVESAEQAEFWITGKVSVYLDLNSGMNRTGIDSTHLLEMIPLAQRLGTRFRGLHWYDGHVSMPNKDERKAAAFAGYDRLMGIVKEFEAAGVSIEEVITSGTPAAPFGYLYPAFRDRSFIHRISPGTVVYNDLSSLKQMEGYGYLPAAIVISSVVSHPQASVITCDAGHKAVSVDSGVPNCVVLGYPTLTPQKPSEEHLPFEMAAGQTDPKIGEKLYLLPKHVCPTVNNFDQALFVRNGQVVTIEPVNARGHEHPLSQATYSS